MKITCCIWAFSPPDTEILRQVRELGFDWIDIQPGQLQTLESRLLAQELGIRVSCVGASFGMPPGSALDSPDPAARQAAVDHVAKAIEQAADVRADTVYVVPGKDESGEALRKFAESLTGLADVASKRNVKLAIEHFPGTALPTAARTLEFILQAGHRNLYLLIDTGHLQITGEEAAGTILNAGDRVAYVHFDDNDGIGDLHWALLDGVMTEESLATTIAALDDIGYQGALSLELNPKLPKVKRALQSSRDILIRSCLL
ncbi:MAG: sugar phosphate isomerase/epimerase [Chloroflexi bacterium]|nr:sugar phosphate isomerase/epimerase [Chloroflexota bacterium]